MKVLGTMSKTPALTALSTRFGLSTDAQTHVVPRFITTIVSSLRQGKVAKRVPSGARRAGFTVVFALFTATAFAQSQHGVSLSWAPSPDSGVSYNVYRQNSACPTIQPTTFTGFTKINSAAIGTLAYFDANPAPRGTTMCYCLSAVDTASGLESVPSGTSQVVFLPPPFPPGAPNTKVQ